MQHIYTTHTQTETAEPHSEPAELPGVHGDVCLHHHPALPRVHEQRPHRAGGVPDPHPPLPLPHDWIHTHRARRVRARLGRAQDDCAGRDAAPDAAEEHHGVGQHAQGLLHIHPQHNTGRRRPHAGAQGSAADPRAQASELHPVGAGQHPGGAVPQEPVHRHAQQGLGPDARQPHRHLTAVRAHGGPVRQAAQEERLLGAVPAGAHLPGRAGGVRQRAGGRHRAHRGVPGRRETRLRILGTQRAGAGGGGGGARGRGGGLENVPPGATVILIVSIGYYSIYPTACRLAWLSSNFLVSSC
jgi:hypothetical protein